MHLNNINEIFVRSLKFVFNKILRRLLQMAHATVPKHLYLKTLNKVIIALIIMLVTIFFTVI